MAKLLDFNFHQWKKLLVFMPHPDDESVFCAGLIQQVIKTGIKTRVVTLTAGEATTLHYSVKPDEDITYARRKELINALHMLGCTDHQLLNFPDGQLTDDFNLKHAILNEINTYKPSHVLTLEPDGIYGHPDHIALSQVVTQIIKPPLTLIYATVTPKYIFPKAKHMAKKAIIKPILPTYKLTLSLIEVVNKIRALRCHQSQFKISLFDPQVLAFLTINDMLFHEYYVV